MPDLRTMLHEAAHAAPVAPATGAVEGDLARGRRALARNRRTRRTVASTALVAASAAGLLIVGARSPSAVTVTGQPSGGSAAGTNLSAGISLVAYTGTQPAGYTIDKVPDGWRIQGDDRYNLVIAPPATTNQDPTYLPGKVLIHKANAAEVADRYPNRRTIKVGGVTARLFDFPRSHSSGKEAQAKAQTKGVHVADPGDAQGLLLPVGHGSYLIFQIPGTLHWHAATVAEFAASVHMTAAARAALG